MKTKNLFMIGLFGVAGFFLYDMYVKNYQKARGDIWAK